eukprot:5108506-Amphidinium_carterae.1
MIVGGQLVSCCGRRGRMTWLVFCVHVTSELLLPQAILARPCIQYQRNTAQTILPDPPPHSTRQPRCSHRHLQPSIGNA